MHPSSLLSITLLSISLLHEIQITIIFAIFPRHRNPDHLSTCNSFQRESLCYFPSPFTLCKLGFSFCLPSKLVLASCYYYSIPWKMVSEKIKWITSIRLASYLHVHSLFNNIMKDERKKRNPRSLLISTFYLVRPKWSKKVFKCPANPNFILI